MDVCQKKQEHLQADDPPDLGDAWVWRAIALPSRLRVVQHLSHQRSEKEASAFLAKFKARTDGRPPLFTSDKLPAYVDALIANYTVPLNHHLSTVGLVARASNRVGYSIQSCVMPRLTNVVSKGGLLRYVGESSLAHLKSSQRFLAANKSTPLMSNVTTSHRVRAMDD
jgi:transposase-like protein